MSNAARTAAILTLLVIFPMLLNAAPHLNEPFELRQPDGSLVPVIVNGDEFYQDVESPDGYPLVRDESGWICFAEPSADGSDWVSSGIRYTPGKEPGGQVAGDGLKKHSRLAPASILSKRKEKFLELNRIPIEQAEREFQSRVQSLSKTAAASGSTIIQPRATPETVVGITILIDFPDQKSSVPRDSIVNLLNMQGYTGFRNNGSIRDYFFDVSNGNMIYTNFVTAFVTATNNKTYYDAGTGYQGSTNLLIDICAKIRAMNLDLSTVTKDNGIIRATNILYAGTPQAGWANGLWPHSGSRREQLATGISMNAHQMSSIGTSLSIGTIVHENGHMLCKWPDLYAYDGHDNGAGRFCVMSSGNATNPQQPNPYFRRLKEWLTVTTITADPPGRLYSHTANGPTAFLWSGATNGTSTREFYYIEARRKTGRSTAVPDEGLLIWHIDEAGNNTQPGVDRCVPEQADGLFQLENKINSGADGDCFHTGYKTQFNDNTAPSAKWHNNANSGIQIDNISAIGNVMTFSLGPNVGTVSENSAAPKASLRAISGSGSGISYTLPGLAEARVRVIIDLFNLNGGLVETLVDGMRATGQRHAVMINGVDRTRVPSGTYLCVMTAAGVRQSAKVVLK